MKRILFFLIFIFSLNSYSQRISYVDKNAKNDYLFSKDNSLSLVSIAKNMNRFNTIRSEKNTVPKIDYISPEMYYFLSKNNQLSTCTVEKSEPYYAALFNSEGEDSLVFDKNSNTFNQVIVLLNKDYFSDLDDISRIVFFEKEIVDSVSKKKVFVQDKIGFAKKYSNVSSKYFITFCVDFEDFIQQKNAMLEFELSNEIASKLTDLNNAKSCYSFLKKQQLQKKAGAQIENNYEMEFGVWFEPTPSEIYQNSNYTTVSREEVLRDMNGEDSLYLDSQTNELIPYKTQVIDTTIYWIDLPSPKVFLKFKVVDHSILNNLSLEAVRFQYKLKNDLSYSVKLSSNSIEQLLASTNFNLYSKSINYKNLNEIPAIHFLSELSNKPAKNYILNNNEGKKKIENEFFTNPYFIKADPNFGAFFK
jgi:hypothetical protein